MISLCVCAYTYIYIYIYIYVYMKDRKNDVDKMESVGPGHDIDGIE